MDPNRTHKFQKHYKYLRALLDTILKFEDIGKMENLEGRGKKQIFTVREQRPIVKKVLPDPKQSDPKILSGGQQETQKTASCQTI